MSRAGDLWDWGRQWYAFSYCGKSLFSVATLLPRLSSCSLNVGRGISTLNHFLHNKCIHPFRPEQLYLFPMLLLLILFFICLYFTRRNVFNRKIRSLFFCFFLGSARSVCKNTSFFYELGACWGCQNKHVLVILNKTDFYFSYLYQRFHTKLILYFFNVTIFVK